MILNLLENLSSCDLTLCENLRIICGHFDGSLCQIICSLDCLGKFHRSVKVWILFPCLHRTLEPAVVHVDDGEELERLGGDEIIQLCAVRYDRELWFLQLLRSLSTEVREKLVKFYRGLYSKEKEGKYQFLRCDYKELCELCLKVLEQSFLTRNSSSEEDRSHTQSPFHGLLHYQYEGICILR